jgi:hypothetical protein
MVLAEVAQVKINLAEASAVGPPYQPRPGYDAGTYLEEAVREASTALRAATTQWPSGALRRFGHIFAELAKVWTGSDHETAMAAVHRAENLALMVMPDARLRSEALKMEAIFKTTNDIRLSDPRHAAYSALFARIRQSVGDEPAAILVADRSLLQDARREQNEAWEIARCRVRIFRNILTATIPFLSLVLVIAAVIAWLNPALLPLRPEPGPSDVGIVEFLGGLGGLLSGVATIRAARNFQRFYGLPLAQGILKIPTGAASALAGVLLLQNGLLGAVANPGWDTIMSYALLFGVAQLAVTKQIDSRAGDLLGESNAKSPSTVPSLSASRRADA